MMSFRVKLLTGCVSVLMLLAIATGTASATRLSLLWAEQGFRIVWPELVFSGGGAGIEEDCRVTLEGTFHRQTFTKVSGLLVGYITRAKSGVCSSKFLTESLPWHVRYQGFSGTLPMMRSLSLFVLGLTLLTAIPPFRCLLTTNNATPWIIALNLEAGSEAQLRLAASATAAGTIPLISLPGSFPCPMSASLGGISDRPTHLGETRELGIRLI